MAGLGGSLGYAMGGINWDNTFIGKLLITVRLMSCVLKIDHDYPKMER